MPSLKKKKTKNRTCFYFCETEMVELNWSYIQESVSKLKIIKLFSPFDVGDTWWIFHFLY